MARHTPALSFDQVNSKYLDNVLDVKYNFSTSMSSANYPNLPSNYLCIVPDVHILGTWCYTWHFQTQNGVLERIMRNNISFGKLLRLED